VAVEQLNDARDFAEGGDARERLGLVDRIDEPDATVGRQRVARPAHGLTAQDPREARSVLVNLDVSLGTTIERQLCRGRCGPRSRRAGILARLTARSLAAVEAPLSEG